MGGAVTHQHKSGSLSGSLRRIRKAGIRRSGCNNGLSDSFLVGIDDGGIGANLTQQGLCHSDALKLIFIGSQNIHHLVIFRTVHQMGGLHNQHLHTVGNSPVHRLLHIVDELAITSLHMVDDDLRGKGTAHGPVRECGSNGVLNALDVLHTAIVVGGTEAYHQNLLVADFIAVAGVVPAGIAGIQTKVIRGGFLTLHQRLLSIGQGIPGCLGGSTLGIRILGTLLDVNRVNQRGNGIRGGLIVHHSFGFRWGWGLRGSGSGGLSSRRCGRLRCTAAGSQQHCHCQHNGNQGTYFFRVHCFSSLCPSHKRFL